MSYSLVLGILACLVQKVDKSLFLPASMKVEIRLVTAPHLSLCQFCSYHHNHTTDFNLTLQIRRTYFVDVPMNQQEIMIQFHFKELCLFKLEFWTLNIILRQQFVIANHLKPHNKISLKFKINKNIQYVIPCQVKAAHSHICV